MSHTDYWNGTRRLMMKEHVFRYVEVKERLIEEINTLQPHVRLLSRTALADKYNAARTTIERAISELIGEGYLYAKDGSGTYIADRQIEERQTSRMSSIGLVIPDIMHDTYPGILRGVEDVTSRYDTSLVICNTDNQIEKQTNYLHKLVEAGVNGIIIVPAIIGTTDLEPFDKLKQLNIPVVFCNRGIDHIQAPKVVSNNFYGAYIAVRHLIQEGCQRIAYISRPLYSTSYERYQGYTSALSEAGMSIDEKYVIFETSFDTDSQGYDSMMSLLEKHPLPDGIFCFNDRIAQGAYEALDKCGIQVGTDIKLVGYDNTSICERLPVKLTSVQFKTYEIGSNAAHLIIEKLKGEPVSDDKIIVLQPQLIVRESSVHPGNKQ